MNIIKSRQFIWRTFRNILCLIPASRRFLFPPDSLASQFGRGDSEYAWNVFLHHFAQLRDVGFQSAQNVLEIGPGRNLGTALLWWAFLTSCKRNELIKIICWDIFENAKPDASGYWSELAQAILREAPKEIKSDSTLSAMQQQLRAVAEGQSIPDIAYCVQSLAVFETTMRSLERTFGLIYSQAAIEHVWHINEFWNAIGRLTSPNGWHSHRIDLADHGCRETNYIEMLEWSGWSYWLTMRFIPGAINRWRACHHLEKIRLMGLEILSQRRILAEHLPVPLSVISPEFRRLDEIELRTLALDVVSKNMVLKI